MAAAAHNVEILIYESPQRLARITPAFDRITEKTHSNSVFIIVPLHDIGIDDCQQCKTNTQYRIARRQKTQQHKWIFHMPLQEQIASFFRDTKTVLLSPKVYFSPATLYVLGAAAICGALRHNGWVVRNTSMYFFLALAGIVFTWLTLSALWTKSREQDLNAALQYLDRLQNRRQQRRIAGRIPPSIEDEITQIDKFLADLPDEHFGRSVFQDSTNEDELPLSDNVFSLTPQAVLDHTRPFVRVGIEQIPALFTALGIFFTFYGLISGLGGLDLGAETNEIKDGLQQLLGGVGLAFESSLAGIFLSFTSLVTARVTLAQLGRTCERLRTVASQLAQKSAPEQVLRRLEILETQNTQKMERFITLSEDQNKTLGTLASDLATAIDEKLKTALDENLGSPLSQMSEKLDVFAEDQANTQNQLLEGLLENFNSQFSENLGTQFQRLDGVLRDVIQWQEETRQLYDDIWQKLERHTEAQSAALKLQQTSLKARMASDMRQLRQLQEFNQRGDEAIKGLDGLSKTMESYAETMHYSARNLAETQSDLSNALSLVDNLGETLGDTSRDIKEGLEEQLRGVEDVLTRTIGDFQKNLELMPERYQELLKEIRLELHDGIKNTFGEFDKETAQIVDRLSGSYIQLDSGLGDFNKTIELLSNELEHFNKQNSGGVQKASSDRSHSTSKSNTLSAANPAE